MLLLFNSGLFMLLYFVLFIAFLSFEPFLISTLLKRRGIETNFIKIALSLLPIWFLRLLAAIAIDMIFKITVNIPQTQTQSILQYLTISIPTILTTLPASVFIIWLTHKKPSLSSIFILLLLAQLISAFLYGTAVGYALFDFH